MAPIPRAVPPHPPKRIDRRALATALAIHALVLCWLLAERSPVPPLGTATPSMILIDLTDARTPVREPSPQAATAPKPAPPIRKKATAPRQSGAGPAQPRERLVVAPDGRDALGNASAVSAAQGTDAANASPVAAAGASGRAATDRGLGGAPRFRPPRVRHRPLPSYPREALLAHKQGTVAVLVTISDEGSPTAATLHRSSGTRSLDDAATAAVMKWGFRPAESDGKPVAAQAIVLVDWTIGPTRIVRLGANL